MTPIVTFEETHNRQKIYVTPTSFQILSQVEPMEETSVEHVEEVVTRPIAKYQEHLEP